MKARMLRILTLGILVSITSCSKKLSPNEFASFLKDEDNGLVQKDQVGAITYKAKYLPKEFTVLKNMAPSERSDADLFQSYSKEYDDYEFYSLALSSHTHLDFLKTALQHNQEYFQRAAYYTTWAKRDMGLVCGRDTLPCAIYHMERSYGLGPESSILIGFKKQSISEPNKDRTLIFRDRVFGSGWLEFTFDKNDIKNIPQIEI